MIPKSGQPGKVRLLGIPTIYDRVCQQAILNRLEPIFDPVFDDANYPEFPDYCNEVGGVIPNLEKRSLWCFVISPTCSF